MVIGKPEEIGSVGESRAVRWLLGGAAFVVLVAGARASADIVVLFLLSVILAVLFAGPMSWMESRGVPRWIAVSLIMILLLLVTFAFGTVIGASVIDFTGSLPFYQERLQEEVGGLLAWMAGHGVVVSRDIVAENFDPAAILTIAGRIFTGIGDVLGRIGLILLIMTFILLEWSGFPDKIRVAFAHSEGHLDRLREISRNIKRYLMLKTLISLATGVLVTVWLLILGVDFPVLWGTLAFLLNYIPNIGSFIAAVPAILLGFLQMGFGGALLTALGYLVINTVLANLIEPRVMGEGVGLSTLVVFLSLVFWGWVLGPIGMLLSVPLTMIFRILLDAVDETRWLAVLLGPRTEPARPD
ncbi:MAG: AI-2E family transporter [Gemmatimonadales bacterium]|jgi:predicted PurR-regulated permease PerM